MTGKSNGKTNGVVSIGKVTGRVLDPKPVPVSPKQPKKKDKAKVEELSPLKWNGVSDGTACITERNGIKYLAIVLDGVYLQVPQNREAIEWLQHKLNTFQCHNHFSSAATEVDNPIII